MFLKASIYELRGAIAESKERGKPTWIPRIIYSSYHVTKRLFIRLKKPYIITDMADKYLRLFTISSVFFILITINGCLGAPQDGCEDLKSELAEIKVRTAQIQNDLQSAQDANEVAQRELETARNRIFELESTLKAEQTESIRNQEEAKELQDRVADLEQQLENYQNKVSNLEERLAQVYAEVYVPAHSIELSEIESNATFWNSGWTDTSLLLQVQAIVTKYFQDHTYVEDETDKNDLVIDIWNKLGTGGILSVIARGNLDVTDELFMECDHTWLLVPNYRGIIWALECTTGETYSIWNAQTDPQLEQYWEGFFYANPSDFAADWEGLLHANPSDS